MTFEHITKQVGLGLLSLGSAFVSATILGELIFGHEGSEVFLPFLETLNVSATLLVGFSLTSGLSYFTGKQLLKLRKNNKLLKKDNLEKEILRLAVLNEGSLTLSQTILEIDISVEEAKITLDTLSEEGIFKTGLNEQGTAVYQLIDFVSSEQIENNSPFIELIY